MPSSLDPSFLCARTLCRKGRSAPNLPFPVKPGAVCTTRTQSSRRTCSPNPWTIQLPGGRVRMRVRKQNAESVVICAPVMTRYIDDRRIISLARSRTYVYPLRALLDLPMRFPRQVQVHPYQSFVCPDPDRPPTSRRRAAASPRSRVDGDLQKSRRGVGRDSGCSEPGPESSLSVAMWHLSSATRAMTRARTAAG